MRKKHTSRSCGHLIVNEKETVIENKKYGNRYRLDLLLGEGTFGKVFKATDVSR